MKSYDETIQSVFQRMDEYKMVQKKRRKMIRRTVSALCCICLVAGMCFGVGKSGIFSGNLPGHSGNDGNSGTLAETKPDDVSGENGASSAEKAAKKDAGNLYVVAGNYGRVYDVLREMTSFAGDLGEDDNLEHGSVDMVEWGSVFNTSDSAGSVTNDEYQDIDNEEQSGYSKTNLQTEGVDESDIIKTDGSYIYTVKDNTVSITDVRNGEMKVAGKITVATNSASNQILEMYVDKNTVNLIVSKQESKLKRSAADETEDKSDMSLTEEIFDSYYLDTVWITELLTYDISNPQNPVLKGCVSQEGAYQTSRKIGNIVYLFTNNFLSRPRTFWEGTAGTDDGYDWIPRVNGETIEADCIYVPERGNSGLVISSVNIQDPEKILDNVMIVNDYVQVYVSTTAIYLYGQRYETSLVTEIAKFSMEQGIINAVGAANVPGGVNDTFAIHEYQGRLRILTTDWNGEENENNLYLFDKNLELTGKLEGLAPGEQIYSARFFQNMAYFVTYRNMDPLFAVDLSDETNPRVLSELKITGFSEYLHFWGKDKLVGIGYETDPENGSRIGLKITMFDISDPADLKTLGTCVLNNIYYSPALYNYKCVLVDEGENLIGFGIETGYGSNYLLFSWENGQFTELMTENLEERNFDQYRGIYINDMFYLAHPEGITSYDRTNGYKMVQNLKF